jgi:hypothetical protein
MRRQSKAQVALNIMELQMDRTRARIASATSREVMRSIRGELVMITTALKKVKQKVSSIVSRRSWLEVSCDEMHTLLLNIEDELLMSFELIEFDSCEFSSFFLVLFRTKDASSTSLRFSNRLL